MLEARYLPYSAISVISTIIIRFLRFCVHAYLKVLCTRLPIFTVKILVPLTALSRANSDFLSWGWKILIGPFNDRASRILHRHTILPTHLPTAIFCNIRHIAATLPHYAIHYRLPFYYVAKPNVEWRLYTFGLRKSLSF